MNIVLVGYRGSGKSSVGKVLAKRLGWSFVDTDALTEQRSGQTIREIFADRAEDGFRELEFEVVAEVAARDQHVISTGGGVVLREANVLSLKANGKLVWLTASPVVLWSRIQQDPSRAGTRKERSSFDELQEVREALTERVPIYADVANLTVKTTDRSIEEIADLVIEGIALRWPHAL